MWVGTEKFASKDVAFFLPVAGYLSHVDRSTLFALGSCSDPAQWTGGHQQPNQLFHRPKHCPGELFDQHRTCDLTMTCAIVFKLLLTALTLGCCRKFHIFAPVSVPTWGAPAGIPQWCYQHPIGGAPYRTPSLERGQLWGSLQEDALPKLRLQDSDHKWTLGKFLLE